MKSFTLHLRGQAPQTFTSDDGRHRLSYEFEAFRHHADERASSPLNIPYLSRVALEVAIAVEKTRVR